MYSSYNFNDAQRLLIKPFERLQFVIIFVLATALSQVIPYLFSRQPAFELLAQSSRIQYGIVIGIITGSFVGASQWIVLRKYIPTCKWILVVVLSITFITTNQTMSELWKESVISSNLSKQEIIVWGIFTFLTSTGSIFIAGYLQWYVLRPYITRSRWWIIVPFISGIVIILVFLTGGILLGFLNWKGDFFYSFADGVNKLNTNFLRLTLAPATQAIAFCILQRKSLSENPILDSPIALAPDIVDYREIKRLERKLYNNISDIWKTDLIVSIEQLTYLIGVNHIGEILICQPINQASFHNIDQTPLFELVRNLNDILLNPEEVTSLAKFQVIFKQPSIIDIYSCRGVPLNWLGIAVYSAIIGINILCAGLKINILS